MALPFRRLGALFTVLALALGLSATMALSSPAAHASTCRDNPYQGTWKAVNPNGQLINVIIAFPNCTNWSTVQVQVLSHSFLGLSSKPSYWGYPNRVQWGYVGTSLTVTYTFKGLTESLRIRPSAKYIGLPVDETQYFANGQRRTLPTQYFGRI